MQSSTTSIVNLNSLPRPDARALDKSPRKKGRLWSWGSMRGRVDGPRQPSAGTLPRGWRQVTKQNSLVDSSEPPQRTTFILEKQDNESFGFEIQTYGLEPSPHSMGDMCTFVCMVHKDSLADFAGLTAGDVILTVNGLSVQGSPHQHVIDAVRQSANLLKIETVCGTIMKRIELQNKRSLLKQTLREKWAELQKLLLQEQQLRRGGSTYTRTCSMPASTDSSPVSPEVFPPAGLRWPSDCSFRSYLTEDGDQASVFEDAFSPSPDCATAGGGGGGNEGCFFSQGFLPDRQEVESLGRKALLRGSSSGSSVHVLDRAISYDSSGYSSSSSSSWSPSPSPTSWEDSRASSLFGTLPRKGGRGKGSVRVRQHLLKLIPGFRRPVKEENAAEEPEPRVVFSAGGQNRQNKGPLKAFS